MKKCSVPKYSVQNLLDHYFCNENLMMINEPDDDNQYFFERCGKLNDAQRLTSVASPPQNLILTLKQFKYDQRYDMQAKLMHDLCYDETVSIKVYSPHTGESYSAVYKLYATVVRTVDSGHYYTYGRETDDIWYKMDDNFVTTSSIHELHRLKTEDIPYLLFYRMDYSLNDRGDLLGFNTTIPPTLHELRLQNSVRQLTNEELPMNLDYCQNDRGDSLRFNIIIPPTAYELGMNNSKTQLTNEELRMDIGCSQNDRRDLLGFDIPIPPTLYELGMNNSKTHLRNEELPMKKQIAAEKHVIPVAGVVCSVCGGIFPNGSKLQRHETSHSDEKPFKCIAPNCQKRYKTKSNLMQHVRHTHSRHLLKF